MAHSVEEGIALATETAACNVEVCDDIGFLLKSNIMGHYFAHLRIEKKYIYSTDKSLLALISTLPPVTLPYGGERFSKL